MAKEKNNPFKKVTEQLPFYPDLTQEKQEPFYCMYAGETTLGDDPSKALPAFILADANTGEEVFCIKSYAVKKTIEAARADLKDLTNIVFCFEFLGKTEVKGKPFNKFNGSYCTLEDYKAFIGNEAKPKSKK